MLLLVYRSCVHDLKTNLLEEEIQWDVYSARGY